MINPIFSDTEIKALEVERFTYPHPMVQRRMEALYLKSKGLEHGLILEICCISEPTLVRYLRAYEKEGLAGLKRLGYVGQPSQIRSHVGSLEEHFRQHPPATSAQAQADIKRLTGLDRSPTQVRKFLHNIGMKHRKTGFVPGPSDTPEKQAEQAAFVKEKLQPKLAQAQAGQRVVLFMDAAHFIYTVFLGFLWCFQRIFLRSPSGRKRFNVLGCLNAITHQLHSFTNEGYINALSVCELLTQVAEFYGSSIPITIFLDNAKYQHCQLVRDHAKMLGIELEFLPSYSPNLNLIERYWKWIKKRCLYSKYYEDFSAMKSEILNRMSKGHQEDKKELSSLITCNFQTFSNVTFLAV